MTAAVSAGQTCVTGQIMDIFCINRGTLLEVQNAVKTACWSALRNAGMTFSSDVTAGIEIKTAPPLSVEVQPG